MQDASWAGWGGSLRNCLENKLNNFSTTKNRLPGKQAKKRPFVKDIILNFIVRCRKGVRQEKHTKNDW